MKSLMIAASAAVVSLAALPAVSQAQEVYGTVGYGAVEIDAGGDGVSLGAIQGRLGYKFTPNIGVEGELGFGVKDDGDIELGPQGGVYGIAFAPVTPNFDLFARAGYSGASIDTPVGDVDADGFAYGVGGQYYFTDKDGIRLDWTRHDYDDAEADVWGVAYTRKF